MKRKLLKISLAIIGTILMVFLIFFLLLYFNREQIKKKIVTEINTQLEAPVDVDNIDISLRKFPLASLLLSEVYSQGAHSQAGDTLIYAREVFLEFSIWQILSSTISISRISIEDGTINIVQRPNEKHNYLIWKEDTTSNKESIFALEDLQLSDLKCSYNKLIDDPLRTTFYLYEGGLEGDFASDYYRLASNAKMKLRSIAVNSQNYLSDVEVETNFKLKGNTDSIILSEGKAILNDISFNYGVLTTEEVILAEAGNSSIDLKSLQALLADQKLYDFKETDLSGNISAKLKYTLPQGAESTLVINFSADNAELSGKGAEVSKIKVQGRYALTGGKDNLSIDSFTGKGKTGNIAGRLKMLNLNSPQVDLQLESDLALEEWLLFFPQENLKGANGQTKVEISFKNKFRSLDNIKPSDLRSASVNGTLELDDINFFIKDTDKKVRDLNGKFQFNNIRLDVERLFFKMGKSDVYLEGNLDNALNFFLFEDQPLKVNASLKSQEIKLQDFLFESKSEKKNQPDLTKNLILNLRLQVDKLTYKSFYATETRGLLQIQNKRVSLNDLFLKTDGGTFKGKFILNTSKPDRNDLDATLVVEGVNIHDLFISFNNFGQDAISSKNIYGTGSAELDLKSSFTKDMEVIPNSIKTIARLKITDGNLKDYEPLNALSNFAEISELKDVTFKLLENTITIENSTISIPQMDITSSVLNLKIYGTHTFTNEIDYHLKLKLEDLLFAKRKKKPGKSEFDDFIFEEKTDNNTYIPIEISGTVDKPVISLDNKNLKKSIEDDLKQQGNELKNIFKKDKPDPKKGSGIQFEWEEDDG